MGMGLQSRTRFYLIHQISQGWQNTGRHKKLKVFFLNRKKKKKKKIEKERKKEGFDLKREEKQKKRREYRIYKGTKFSLKERVEKISKEGFENWTIKRESFGME